MKCEICENDFDKTELRSFKRFDHLCSVCYAKESTIPVNTDRKLTPAEIKNQDDIKAREDFFNAEVTAIKDIPGTPFERANAVKARIDGWKKILFEASNREYAAFKTLQDLARELTREEREKLKLVDTTYTPSTVVVKPKAPKTRMSAEDKALSQMAKTIFGKKLLMQESADKACYAEHPDWWNNGSVIAGKQKEYEAYLTNRGAMTMEMAIAQMKQTVRNARATNFQQLANGERSLSDPLEADSDRKAN